MAKFVFIYTGGSMAETEEEQQKQMAAWGAWFEKLGGAVVDMGAPFGASTSVGNGGGTRATGYTIVSAGSLDDAAALAQGSPILQNGGGVEVYEAMEM